MSEAKNKFDYINGLPAMKFMDDPVVKDAFILLNRNLHDTKPQESEVFYERERVAIKKVIFSSINPEKPRNDLRNCTTFSLYSCFMDMAMNGDILSFNPDDKLAFIEPRGYKIGKDDKGKDIYEQRASLKLTPYGELAVRMHAGQVKYADNVIVVYEGDELEIKTDNTGSVFVQWKSKIPRASKKIIGSFVKLTRPDNSALVYYMLEEEIERLEEYSKRNNFGKANALYGDAEKGKGIDSGFLKAKTLKHSFSTFPKCRVKGTTISLDDVGPDQMDEQDLNEAGDDYMQKRMDEQAPPAAKADPPKQAAPVIKQETPGLSKDGSSGVTISDPDEDEF